MLIYHGTTAARARAALIGGLAPRIATGVQTNFSDMPSRPDLVYLTTIYAGYYALRAADTSEERAIIEIDLDLLDANLLLPDEDFVERRDRPPQTSPEQVGIRLADIRARLEEHRELAATSLRDGTCAYKGVIPSVAFKRIAYFPYGDDPVLYFFGKIGEPTTLYGNRDGKLLLGRCTRWVFGDLTPTSWRQECWPLLKQVLPMAKEIPHAKCPLRRGYYVEQLKT
jgi:hypothetical protein